MKGETKNWIINILNRQPVNAVYRHSLHSWNPPSPPPLLKGGEGPSKN